jgi:hypothetical protein
MSENRAPGIGAAQFADEVGEVVVQLAGVGDVAPRSRGAVAAEVDRDRSHAGCGERRRDAIHLDRARRRAVGQNRDPITPSACRRIEPVGKPGPVAGLKAAEIGRVDGVDPHRAFMNRGERRRHAHGRSQHEGERDRRGPRQGQEPNADAGKDKYRHHESPFRVLY